MLVDDFRRVFIQRNERQITGKLFPLKGKIFTLAFS